MERALIINIIVNHKYIWFNYYMTDRDYNHSRPLDVHRSSNYSEVNPFIDEI